MQYHANIFKITCVIVFSLWHSSMIFCAQPPAKYTLSQRVDQNGDEVKLIITLRNNKSGRSITSCDTSVERGGQLQLQSGVMDYGATPKYKRQKMLRLHMIAREKYLGPNILNPEERAQRREFSFCREDLPHAKPFTRGAKLKKILGWY